MVVVAVAVIVTGSNGCSWLVGSRNCPAVAVVVAGRSVSNLTYAKEENV